MRRKEAIETIADSFLKTDEKLFVVSSTGLISRELYNYRDMPEFFYMTGSLGLASSIALGVAISKPEKRVVAIDGDAALLLNMGSLATIAHFAPKNLIHILLDNSAYGSCSEEPSFSQTVNLREMAIAAGYPLTARVKNEEALFSTMTDFLEKKGPSFIHAVIELGGRRDLPRPLDLPSIARRFRQRLINEGNL